MNLEVESSLPTPEDLSAYLGLRGWYRELGGRNASVWYNNNISEEDARQLGAGEPSLLVPHLEGASDYADRVAMLFQQLSRLQQQSIETVKRDAALVHFDVIPIRAADVAAIDDSIPLQAGLELYGAARKMVVAAAGATVRRASHFGRSLPGAARDHTRVVRVGQTQRGSYIVPVISRARFGLEQTQAGPDQHLDVQVEESLFDRRVMGTLATALARLQNVTDANRGPKGAELTDAVSVGVSRELCMGVLKALNSPAISELSIGFEWAPATSRPRGTPDQVSFSDHSADMLQSIAERLRVLDLPREDVLYGLVTELRHRPNDPERRVGVEALVGRRVRTVHMRLTPEQYEIAQECHERSKVVVRGRLRAPAGDRAVMEVDYFGPDTSLADIGLEGAATSKAKSK